MEDQFAKKLPKECQIYNQSINYYISKIILCVIMQPQTEDKRQEKQNIKSQKQQQIVNKSSNVFDTQNPLKILQSVNRPTIKLIDQTKLLFKHLIVDQKICMRCVFRIYSIESLTFYRDSSSYVDFVLKYCGQQCLQTSFNKQSETIQKNSKFYKIDAFCFEKLCWLCEGTLQNPYIKDTSKQIVNLLQKRRIKGLEKYKLNVKVPSYFVVKFHIFKQEMYDRMKKADPDPNSVPVYGKLLLNEAVLQIKTILKWLISAQLNGNLQLPLQSTIAEDQKTVIANLQINYRNAQNEKNLMSAFVLQANSIMASQAKNPYKKIKLQQRDISCTQDNIRRVIKLPHQDIVRIVNGCKARDQEYIYRGNKKEETSNHWTQVSIYTQNIYLCGRYIKFCRYLPQTPWLINQQRLAPSSIQQEIQNKIYRFFYPNKQLTKENDSIQTKFHSGGRQDVDVRMLVGGRPFVLQFVSPLLRIQELDINQLSKSLTEEQIKQIQEKYGDFCNKNKIVKYLQAIINKDSKFIQVVNLMPTSVSYISTQLKKAQMQKIKHYVCYIQTKQVITEQDVKRVQSVVNLKIDQKTPIRVLHRRTLMIRQKKVHKMLMKTVSKCSAVLQIWASAGTYIKQFVHGDLERTKPNMKQLLNGKEVDILQLDVGSLKEGEWNEQDIQGMKLGKLDWEQQ